MSQLFNVVFQGEIAHEFDRNQVIQTFASTFGVDINKAENYFTGEQRVLKKNTDELTAQKFKKALEKIGAVTHIKAIAPAKVSLDSLSLVPKAEEEIENAKANAQSVKQEQNNPANSVSHFACPKCGAEQEKTEKCSSCGIYFQKYFAQQNNKPAVNLTLEPKETDTDNSFEPDEEEVIEEATVESSGNLLKPLVAASIAAALGAAAWFIIMTKFQYEVGYVAWAIGGLVGFSAALLGGNGQKIGIACGILALLSIFAGKYLSYESMLKDALADMQPMYLAQSQNAERYMAVKDSPPLLKQFMIDLEYTYATTTDEVYDDELVEFKQSAGQEFESFAMNQPSFEQWLQPLFEEAGISSSIEMMKDDFDGKDIIFLLLGIGTAFQLGRGRKE